MANKELKKYVPEISEMRHIMTVVKNTGDLPVGKRHLYTRYKNVGLINMQTKQTPTGGTIFGKVKLTKEGKKLYESFRMD